MLACGGYGDLLVESKLEVLGDLGMPKQVIYPESPFDFATQQTYDLGS